MTYSHEQLKAMCPLSISECSQKHVQSVVAELIETALAQPASAPAVQAPAEAHGDELEMCACGDIPASACHSYQRGWGCAMTANDKIEVLTAALKTKAQPKAAEGDDLAAFEDALRANGLATDDVWKRAAYLTMFRAGRAANVQPKGTAANAALVPMETLKTWKGMVNTLAALSLKSDRITTGIALKSFIQDQIDEAQAHTPAPEPASTRERWNIERDGDALLVCFNDHEKGQGCRFERFVPESTQAPAPAHATLNEDAIDWPDVESMAHSACEEALAFGVGHEVFHRHMRAVMDKTAQAFRAAIVSPAVPHGKKEQQ